MDSDRRSVCMFSSSFFTASGLLVDIFDGVFDRKSHETSNYRGMPARSRPPTVRRWGGDCNPPLLYSAVLEKEIKKRRGPLTQCNHVSAVSARAQESSDDTGIRVSSSQPADVSSAK